MDQETETTPSVYRRVIAVGLFLDGDEVLMLHQMTGPEPNRWDLPGGGVELGESLIQALRREVEEETSITAFEVERILTVSERFYPKPIGQQHTINIVYLCSLAARPQQLISNDPHEVGPQGIQWLQISTLNPQSCSSRAWESLQAAGKV